jgi:hypothetical protein
MARRASDYIQRLLWHWQSNTVTMVRTASATCWQARHLSGMHQKERPAPGFRTQSGPSLERAGESSSSDSSRRRPAASSLNDWPRVESAGAGPTSLPTRGLPLEASQVGQRRVTHSQRKASAPVACQKPRHGAAWTAPTQKGALRPHPFNAFFALPIAV